LIFGATCCNQGGININFIKLVELIQQMSGNYCRRTDDIYILPSNVEKLTVLLNSCDDFHSILITPFLLNIKNDTIYELHYYEFEIEIRDIQKSHYLDYAKENILPKEIIENIKPKAIISVGDNAFMTNALNSYFTAINKMTFDSDKQSIAALEDSSLYFQIY